MSYEKKSIKIDLELYNELEKKFQAEELNLGLINIKNVEEFIEYILKNFSNSSKQFESLSEEQKQSLNNIDISKINVNDLFEQISKIAKKDKNTNNNDNNNNKLIN